MGVLTGKSVAILATDGFEQVELTEPMKRVKDEGAEVHIVSLESGQIQGMNHDEKGDTFSVDKTVDEVSADDYNGLILPGGVLNPDTLRTNDKAVQLVRDFFVQHKPVSAICHGPWLLAEADVLKNRTITSFSSIKTDLINAGAKWVDEEVVVDQGLTTSRDPNDMEAFCKKVVEELREGKHEKQTV
ncbi:type 1 glutamine amidotransferase [Salinimonas marina]|uniref:Type 1 glutamine amidotransferase n=1 Tax=Salinimonas marina TaxID=2785918 RepID=A0A7S9DZ95_9ALTE|nr:type 1 glutamine amidotransferase domain-containing protein [Salinimonas marina]QPG06673.1 type 1 glutamine amidotransferase [Salinimonas marina]